MDITDKILSDLHEENQSDRTYLSDLISEFQNDVLWLDASNMNDVESQLMVSQYAYIKFGLILEKIRNQCFWKKCLEKFSDFRHFCQVKANLNIWQVTNAIKSAQVAVRLSSLGFSDLPRNASQALKLAELSIERLGEVWGNILAKHRGHKITASAIADEIAPAVRNAIETLRIPVDVADKLRRNAIERGLTLSEYLGQLANGEPDGVEPIGEGEREGEEIGREVIDALDLKFRSHDRQVSAKNVIEASVAGFDALMEGLIGQFIPPPTKRARA
jgi:hypothetical protein